MVPDRFTTFVIALSFATTASSLFAQNASAPAQPITPQSQGNPAASQQPSAAPVPPQTTPQGQPQPATPVPPAGQVPGPQAAPERRMLPSPTAPSGGMVSLNFNRADLVEIIHIIAQHLRLTYTIDPEVKGTVTINSAEPLRTEDLLPVFHQVLRMNGAVAVKTGNLYHIMPIKDGKGLARPVGQNKEDSFALQIIPVRFFSVAEMKKVLTPFLQPGAEIIDNPRGNFLVVMDLPSNIQRLMEIADLIDVQVFAGTRMELYQPKVASAEDLAQEMTKVMQSFASSAPQSDSFTAEFIALPRINHLLVISHSEAAWTYAKRWLDRIDVIAEGPGRRIFIYPVENGKAEDLANVLNQALGQPAAATKSSTQTLQDLHRFTTSSGTAQTGGQFGARSPTTPSFGSPFGSPGMSSGFPYAQAAVAVPGQPPAPTPGPAAPPPSPGIARPPTPGPQAQRPEEQLRIVADPATNSLIIYGSAQEFQNIKNILKELDLVPRQVLLDVLVAEVTLNNTENFGIEYEIFKGNTSIFGQTFGSGGAVRSGILPGLPDGATITPFGNGISGIIGRSNSVRAFINALATDSRVKILSSPSVLATDNRPARIQVGSEEPIPTGQLVAVVGATSPSSSTTIQYRNTGRIVTIIPQVNSQGLVNLQILAEVSQRGANVTVGTDSFPAFDTRQAETSAVVQDGDTLAIGGIIADNRSRARTGIPYLMDLPVIGRFFGSTSDQLTRTELIMLITPHVIRSRDQGQQITEDFKKSLSTVRNELDRMSREREKLQQQPLQQKPALPGPSGDVVPAPNPPAPAPAPSAAPSGSGASVTPLKKIAADSAPSASSDNMLDLMSVAAPEAVKMAPSAGIVSTDTKNPQQTGVPKPAPQPAYALSVTSRPEIPSNAAAPKPISSRPQVPLKPIQIWTVQVAAMARREDAEALAGMLRDKGYDAYVVTADVNAKTWHRVRVGQSPAIGDASQLQRTLKSSERFEAAYVVASR